MPFEYIESEEELASDESDDEEIFLDYLDQQLDTLREERMERFYERQERVRDLREERRKAEIERQKTLQERREAVAKVRMEEEERARRRRQEDHEKWKEERRERRKKQKEETMEGKKPEERSQQHREYMMNKDRRTNMEKMAKREEAIAIIDLEDSNQSLPDRLLDDDTIQADDTLSKEIEVNHNNAEDEKNFENDRKDDSITPSKSDEENSDEMSYEGSNEGDQTTEDAEELAVIEEDREEVQDEQFYRQLAQPQLVQPVREAQEIEEDQDVLNMQWEQELLAEIQHVPPEMIQLQEQPPTQPISRVDQVTAIFPDVCPLWISDQDHMSLEQLINAIIENPTVAPRIAKPKKRIFSGIADGAEPPSKKQVDSKDESNGQTRIYSTPNSGLVFACNYFSLGFSIEKKNNYIKNLISSLSFEKINWNTAPKVYFYYDPSAQKFLSNYFRKVGVVMIRKLYRILLPGDLFRILELIELDQSRLVTEIIGDEQRRKAWAAIGINHSWEAIENIRAVNWHGNYEVPTLQKEFYSEFKKFLAMKEKYWEGLEMPERGHQCKKVLIGYGPIRDGGRSADANKNNLTTTISKWSPTNATLNASTPSPIANVSVTCIVCFSDVDISRTVSCRPIEKEEGYANINEEGVEHEICLECMIGHSKALCDDGLMATGGAGLPCADHECKRAILWAHVHPHLDKETLSRLEKRIDNEVVMALSNVEYCKYCSFAAQMDSTVEEMKVFVCQQCNAEFCRICKRDFDDEHFGKKCEELDREDVESKKRRLKEEELSQVVIRQCPKCHLAFQKEIGCNKMTCRCGTTQCYVCRKVNIDYKHFCQHLHNPKTPGVCPANCGLSCLLHEDVAKREEKELARIEKEQPLTAHVVLSTSDKPSAVLM